MRVCRSTSNHDDQDSSPVDIAIIRAAQHELRRRPKTTRDPRRIKARRDAHLRLLEEVQA